MSTQSIRISYLVSPHPMPHPNQGNYDFGLTTVYTQPEDPSPALPIMQIPFDQFVANTPLTKMSAERDRLQARVAQLEQENARLEQTVQELTFRLNHVPQADRHLTQQEYVHASQNLGPFNPSTYQQQEIPPNPQLASGVVPPSHYIISKKELDYAIHLLKTRRQDLYNEVVHHVNLAIQANPRNAEAYACKSEVLRLMNKRHECYEATKCALAIDSENIIALVNKSTVLYNFGDYRNSLLCTEKVLEIQPNNIFAIRNKIVNLISLRMFTEAADTLAFAMQSDPNDEELLMFQKRLMEEFIRFKN